jgi:putative membrane protein
VRILLANSKRPAESDDPRVYFAAERTLLAWIRTGLALMGFGFVVARFGLFLRELAAVHQETPGPRTGHSLWIGVALVLLGVVVTAWAALKHYRWIKLLREGVVELPRAVSLVTVLAVSLAALGALIAVVLLFGLTH